MADALVKDPMIHEDGLPGRESTLSPAPEWQPHFPGSGRLEGKVAIVTGADSGIGRAVAVLFVREGIGGFSHHEVRFPAISKRAFAAIIEI